MEKLQCPQLRADARENRARILDTARRVFAERGLGASLDDIARQAGVGVATVYRRFPDREQLIGAVYADKMRTYADTAERAGTQADPWQGFCEFVETVCELQAADKGFADLLTLNVPGAKGLRTDRVRGRTGSAKVIDRARAAGRLRADFVMEDLMLLAMANAGVIAATRDAAPQAWRRLVAYMLQAFSADGAAPLPPAPSPRRMQRVMNRAPARTAASHKRA